MEDLVFWCNGDWRTSGRIEVYWTKDMTRSYPTGLRKEVIADTVFAAMQKFGVFGASGQAVAKSRWWSMQTALTKQVLGLNLHSALPTGEFFIPGSLTSVT